MKVGKLKMKNKKTTFDDANQWLTGYRNTIPTYGEMITLYYEYGKNWKQYSGFSDWFAYFEN